MGKITACSLIIKDDYKNVLIIQRKSKKNSPKLWEILERDIKGKETQEKCVSKMAQKELNTVIFELIPFKEYVNEEKKEESVMLFTGKLKERITLHKDIIIDKWISKNDLDKYDFIPGHKEKLVDYFESIL